ncbi:hypothetical protein GCM10022381_25870 [Leifsonia kafniensis]|uniref:Molybdenum cofactor biosynthesis protein F n=1 Tax=Leifsonia kafniensis TaxID=475957 RepID=A0ABP7KNI5_9MICO
MGFEARPAQPPIDVFVSGQTQFRAAFTDELVGHRIELNGPDSRRVTLEFLESHVLRRTVPGGVAAVELHYDATAVRPGIYLIDYLDPSWPMSSALNSHARLLSWVLELKPARATLAVSGIVTADHPGLGALLRGRTDHEFWSTDIDSSPHPRSSGLVGHRVIWRYSDTDEYEHNYLNSGTFVWQCLRGVERGLSELDPSRAYAIADGLYFFHWSEVDLVVESALVVDLHALRTYGRFYALDAGDAELRHHQFGAVGELLGVAIYPSDPDYRPV